MPKYRVTIKRTFEEFADIEVEAEDRQEAIDDAKAMADDMDVSWSQQQLAEEEVDSCEEINK